MADPQSPPGEPCRPTPRPRSVVSTRCHRSILAACRSSNGDSIRSAPGYQTCSNVPATTRPSMQALRDRLSRVTRHEQAAKAARTIRRPWPQAADAMPRSPGFERRLAAIDRSRTRTFSAVGFVQPSSRVVDGRKLHALIGSNGSTLAYLDIPPGIDVNSLAPVGSASSGSPIIIRTSAPD